ncbi:hypothetical protein QYF36_004117 [Acer negundo]|nr:hypothetical protein QYF36_004117 [Acer negundo]
MKFVEEMNKILRNRLDREISPQLRDLHFGEDLARSTPKWRSSGHQARSRSGGSGKREQRREWEKRSAKGVEAAEVDNGIVGGEGAWMEREVR